MSDRKECKHRSAIQKVQKESSAKIQSLQHTIREKDKMLTDVHELAFDVSSEYDQLVKATKSETQKQKQIEISLKQAAEYRLEQAKQAKEREMHVRESLDSVKESYDDRLDAALSEIEQLKEDLKRKNETIEALQTSLNAAEKEIAVSNVISINNCHIKLIHVF